jgi:hypothetical protein
MLILIVAGLRLFSLVLHAPVVGYANQYDMARLSACLDFWPAGTVQPEMATPQAPLRRYSISNAPDAACLFRSEALLAGTLVQVVHRLTGQTQYDVRVIGLSKSIFLAAAILFFAWRSRRHAWVQLIHAIAVATILSDPFNTLYMNTLYTEFSALFGTYMAVMSLCLMKLDARADKGLMTAFSLGLLILLFSKNQHILLPWLLMMFAVCGLRGIAKPKAWMVLAGILLVGTALQLTLMRHQHDSLAKANIYNVLFLTVLPSVESVGESVETLDLGETCESLVNTSWYRLRGHEPERLCPEAFDVGRVSVLAALAFRPAALMDVVFKSVYQSTAWRVGYLGEIEGERTGKVDIDSGIAYVSVSDLVRIMPYPWYVAFLASPGLYALCAAALRPKAVPADPFGQSAARFMLSVCVSCAFLVWFVAVLGDGYSDLAKHLHLAFNFILAGWVMMLTHGVCMLRAPVRRSRLVLLVILCTSACAFAVRVAIAWPVAVGTLDMPAQTVSAGEKLVLTGWVKDPFGVSEVSAVVGENTHAAVITSTAPDVDAMFPVSSTFPGKRFAVEITVPKESGRFKVVLDIRNSRGRVTAFDSLWLTAVSPMNRQ